MLDAVTPRGGAEYSPSAYRLAMSVQYVGWVLGGVQIMRYRRRARRHLELTQPEVLRRMTGRGLVDPQ